MLRMQLLGGFSLFRDGDPIDVPVSSARVLAFLGLQRTFVPRTALASNLWPRVDGRRALGNLRSAVWRLPEGAREGLRRREGELAIGEHVVCDVHGIDRAARRQSPRLIPPDPCGLCAELLPGWYDDWILVERERLAHWRAELFERLSNTSCQQGRYHDAVLYAVASISVEPLRESAHQALLRAHAAQGNEAEVDSHFEMLVDLLDDALGVGPAPDTRDIVASVRRHRGDAPGGTLSPWHQ